MVKDLNNPEHIKILNALLEVVFDYTRSFYSIKFNTHFLKLSSYLTDALNKLDDFEDWKQIIKVFLKELINKEVKGWLVIYFDAIAKSNYYLDAEKTEFLCEYISNNYEPAYFHFTDSRTELDLKTFPIIKHSKNKGTYCKKYITHYGCLDYNLELINILIESNHLQEAVAQCIRAIDTNYDKAYSVPYWELLKPIYQQQKDYKTLYAKAKYMFPYSLEIEDYRLAMQYFASEPEAKKWASATLGNIKRQAYSFARYQIIWIEVLLEQQAKFDIIKLHSEKSFAIETLFHFFSVFYKKDADALLYLIFTNEKFDNYRYDKKSLELYETYLATIIKNIEDNYSDESIIQTIQRTNLERSYWRENNVKGYFMVKYDIKK